MAIGKLTKGSNASGLVDYLLAEVDHKGDTRPCARIVGGTMGLSARRAKSTFQTFADLRPGLGRNVVHMSISLPEGDRKLVDCNWDDIGRVWAEGMGFEGYLTVLHGDHIHIAASRIRLDGTVVSDSHDYRRSETLIRQIEQEFDLQRVNPSHLLNPKAAVTHITPPRGHRPSMRYGPIWQTMARACCRGDFGSTNLIVGRLAASAMASASAASFF